VLIAGGIGVTPIVAMAERLAALGRDWSMTYAVRRPDEAAFTERLTRHGARVRLHVDAAHGGRPLDVAALVAAAPADAQLYCCGPAPMLDAFESAAAARPRERVHVERFTAAAAPATAGGFLVELARSGRRVSVSPGQTIVEALRTLGVDVAVSCAQGICGTCETRVLAGVPDHRDSLLSDAERAANDVMMICCSGSRTATLTLDL
jgi:vanillate O-demethylase ferredoxin subunit